MEHLILTGLGFLERVSLSMDEGGGRFPPPVNLFYPDNLSH